MISYISEIREKFADGKVSAIRVFDIIDYNTFTKDSYGDTQLTDIIGKIKFQDVNFQYNNKELFKDLNFEIKPNTMVAFVGKSGEGKSTILKLIGKNYKLNSNR